GSDLYRAVFAYNHADWYVREVLGLAGIYGTDTTVPFTLDRMQQSLEAARAAVVAASGQLVTAQAAVRADTKVVARWQSAAAQATLLSDRLTLEQRAGTAAAQRAADAKLVVARTSALAAAQGELDRAQQQTAAASFAPAASQVFAAPSYSSGYVFPVGGGPGVVTASHTHHDYPAVDIDAPEGSPEYALADSVVLRAWSTPDPSCGIGLTLRAFDGQVWTYCHMSVLDSSVVPGAHLAAGEPVGLVGATGDASGPHLHLQLQPADAWPQQEAWFLSFAGKAYSWRDGDTATDSAPGRALEFSAPAPAQAPAPATTAAAPGPVFAVVSNDPPPVVYFSR
ncbi:MAG TPA: M23 family metallopeptidase, partial [Gaiellaceae bacterium]|nr:M23 family metallopeptidase [Gaiellaceae bacterium]